MGEILKEPDAPWIAFLKGAGGTAATVGLPILVPVLFSPREGSDGFWIRLLVCGGVIGAICVLAGIACAIWALVQRWAYDRVTGDPFH